VLSTSSPGCQRYIIDDANVCVLRQQKHDVMMAVGGSLVHCLLVFGVCATVDEELRDVRMAACTRFPQGSILASTHVNAMFQENLYRQVARPTRCQQHIQRIGVRARA
jgi:hypothetical protein